MIDNFKKIKKTKKQNVKHLKISGGGTPKTKKKSMGSKFASKIKYGAQKIGTEAEIGMKRLKGISRNNAKVAILAKQLRKQNSGLEKMSVNNSIIKAEQVLKTRLQGKQAALQKKVINAAKKKVEKSRESGRRSKRYAGIEGLRETKDININQAKKIIGESKQKFRLRTSKKRLARIKDLGNRISDIDQITKITKTEPKEVNIGAAKAVLAANMVKPYSKSVAENLKKNITPEQKKLINSFIKGDITGSKFAENMKAIRTSDANAGAEKAATSGVNAAAKEAEGPAKEAEGPAKEAEGPSKEAEGPAKEAEGPAKEAEGAKEANAGNAKAAEGANAGPAVPTRSDRNSVYEVPKVYSQKEVNAATKVQAAFRGFRTRKKVRQKTLEEIEGLSFINKNTFEKEFIKRSNAYIDKNPGSKEIISGLRSALVKALGPGGQAKNFKDIGNVIKQDNYQAIPKNTPMGAFIQKLQKNISPEFLEKTRKEEKQSERRISKLSKALKISKRYGGIFGKTAPTELKQIVGNIIALKNNKGGKGNLAKQVANGKMITKLETALRKLTPEQRKKLSEKIEKIVIKMQENELTEKWIVDDAKIKLVKSAIGRVNRAQNTTFGTIKSEEALRNNIVPVRVNVGPPLPPKAGTAKNTGTVKKAKTTVRGEGEGNIYARVVKEQPTYVTRDQMRGPQEQPLYELV